MRPLDFELSSKWKFSLSGNLSFLLWLHLMKLSSDWEKRADKKIYILTAKLISQVYRLIAPINRAPWCLYWQRHSYRWRTTNMHLKFNLVRTWLESDSNPQILRCFFVITCKLVFYSVSTESISLVHNISYNLIFPIDVYICSITVTDDLTSSLPNKSMQKKNQSRLASRKAIFEYDLIILPYVVFNFMTWTTSFETPYVSKILPIGQCNKSISFIITFRRPPTLKLHNFEVHFPQTVKMGKYSHSHQLQNISVAAWTDLHFLYKFTSCSLKFPGLLVMPLQ